MPDMISRQQAEALIQEQLINTIQQDTPKNSIFMQLARRLPNMTSKTTRMPVLDMLRWPTGSMEIMASNRPASRRGTTCISLLRNWR